MCHANLLKPYRHRDETQFQKIGRGGMNCHVISCKDFGEAIPTIGECKQSNQFVQDLRHMTTHKEQQLNTILATYSDIFRDTPGRTTM